jgi:hypothetical protein
MLHLYVGPLETPRRTLLVVLSSVFAHLPPIFIQKHNVVNPVALSLDKGNLFHSVYPPKVCAI